MKATQPGRPFTRGRPFADILAPFLASRLALLFVGWAASLRIPGGRPAQSWPMPGAPLAFTMWARYDSQWYLWIAEHGYRVPPSRYTPHAFFPLYPLLMEGTHRLTGLPEVVTGVLLSNALFVGALALLYRLLQPRWGDEVARRSVLYIVLFPTSFYFSSVYTEALFLFSVVAAFLAAERRRWWLAGLAGLAATLTRNLGITLLLPLAWMARERRNPGRPILHDAAPLALLPLGFLGWAAFLWVSTGDPLRWLHAESTWGRKLSPPWAGLVLAADRILTPPPPPPPELFRPGTYVRAWLPQFAPLYSTIDAAAAVSWLLLSAVAVRLRLGWPYVLYMLAGVLVPMSAPTRHSMTPLASMTRYVAVLFPGFVALARLSEPRPWLHSALLALLPTVQGLFFTLFTTWNWIA